MLDNVVIIGASSSLGGAVVEHFRTRTRKTVATYFSGPPISLDAVHWTRLDLTEEEVRQALHSLEDLALVAPVRDARVPKYEHRIRTVLNLRRDETAVLCLLMLRGPQTPSELRSRADRLHTFDDLAAVQSTLERLAARTAPQGRVSPFVRWPASGRAIA